MPNSAFPTPPSPHAAMLLLGPTGSGKTPLGAILQQQGLWGHACRHFDFGANLRQIVAENRPDDSITAEDIAFLRQILHSGALLEDQHFPLAERILKHFLTQTAQPAWIVLNGLPRHLGQARALAGLLDVRLVVCLACSAETVTQRIRTNAGGDRGQRVDDTPEDIRRKLAIFQQRTVPLADYYRSQGARILRIEVAATATPHKTWKTLEASGSHR